MADIIIPGPAGRIEVRHQFQQTSSAPAALILHPHPLHGGTMHNKVTYTLYQAFYKSGFSVCRFNFRGIGKSSGSFDNGDGELSDAATVMDWLQTSLPYAQHFWIAGFSFGAWITMQLLMRRPEIQGVICVSPPVNRYDFTFLSPCPVSGQIIQGTKDDIVDIHAVHLLNNRLAKQKNIVVRLDILEGASHFFLHHLTELSDLVRSYLKSTHVNSGLG